MNNLSAITAGVICFIGGMFMAVKMIDQELCEKVWKVIGLGAVSGAIGYGLTLLLVGTK